jgi:hypothetical protein
VRVWGRLAAVGPSTPVQWIGVNFGCAGDMRDEKGRLWLGYWGERGVVAGTLGPELRLRPEYYPGGWHLERDINRTKTEGTAQPWLYATATRGLKCFTIPLLGKAEGSARYTLRLHFSDPDHDRPGKRVFDVKLQGKTVLENLDIAKETGGRDRALVKELRDVAVTEGLTIEFVGKTRARDRDWDTAREEVAGRREAIARMPILAAVECTRTKWAGARISAPGVLLTGDTPKQSIQVQLGNPWDRPLRGTLHFGVPKGFCVTPAKADVQLPAKQQLSVAFDVSKEGDPAAGDYVIGVRLVRPDGTVAANSAIPLVCLGRRVRAVIGVSEDVWIRRGRKDNYNSRVELSACGSRNTKQFLGQRVTLLKFAKTHVPGKPVAVRLRLLASRSEFSLPFEGRVQLVEEPWGERTATWYNRPRLGRVIGRCRDVLWKSQVEIPLDVDLRKHPELNVALVGTNYYRLLFHARQTGKGPALVVDYEPGPSTKE